MSLDRAHSRRPLARASIHATTILAVVAAISCTQFLGANDPIDLSPDASIATADGGTPSATGIAAAFAHAVCDELASCCLKNALAFNLDNCLVAAAGNAQEQIINPALAVGATYQAAAANACLAAIAKAAQECDDASIASSGGVATAPLSACASAYAGTKAPGATCASSFECAPGPSGSTVSCSYYYPTSDDGGFQPYGEACQVAVFGTVGAACASFDTAPIPTVADCAVAGLACNSINSTCQPRQPIGNSCGQSGDCVNGAYCATPLCAPAPSAGAPCASGACAVGLYCNFASNTCAPMLGAGASCAGDLSDACDGVCDGETATCVTSTVASSVTCGG